MLPSAGLWILPRFMDNNDIIVSVLLPADITNIKASI